MGDKGKNRVCVPAVKHGCGMVTEDMGVFWGRKIWRLSPNDRNHE